MFLANSILNFLIFYFFARNLLSIYYSIPRFSLPNSAIYSSNPSIYSSCFPISLLLSSHFFSKFSLLIENSTNCSPINFFFLFNLSYFQPNSLISSELFSYNKLKLLDNDLSSLPILSHCCFFICNSFDIYPYYFNFISISVQSSIAISGSVATSTISTPIPFPLF